jgi:CelD/BcsL family acetyltransferase involved in cellulose biosynthesis
LRRFSAGLAARGELWLTTLDLDGEAVAAWHGFASGDTVYFYQSGRDPARDSESVGAVLMAAMIRRAIERGYRRLDLLRGDDAYKQEWGATNRPIHEVLVFRPGWRGAWLRTLDQVGRTRARLRSRPEFAGG